MLRTLSLLLVLLWLHPLRAQTIQKSQEVHVDDPVSDRSPSLVDESDRATVAAGLPDLRSVVMPPGVREVRIWIRESYLYPQSLYRFVDDETVSAELILYWPEEPWNVGSEELDDLVPPDRMQYYLRGRCEGFREAKEMGVCRALFTAPPDWRTTLGRAEAANLWTLPDESTLPEPDLDFMVLDGWGMFVELREGDQYRSYYYGNPDAVRPDQPEAIQAIEIAEAMRAVGALQRPPDIRQRFRGVTSGVYTSAIRLCGGDTTWMFDDDIRRLSTVAGIPFPGPDDDDTFYDDGRLYYVEVIAQPSPEWVAHFREWDYPRALQLIELVEVREWTGGECDEE